MFMRDQKTLLCTGKTTLNDNTISAYLCHFFNPLSPTFCVFFSWMIEHASRHFGLYNFYHSHLFGEFWSYYFIVIY